MKLKQFSIRTWAPATALVMACAGAALSAVLLVQYLQPDAGVCATSGCDAARQSALASLAGIPLPLLGLLHFVLVGVLARGRLAPLGRGLAITGGVAGAALLVYQGAVLGAFCPLCVAVDLSAIGLAGAVIAAGTLSGGRWQPARVALPVVAVAAGILVALGQGGASGAGGGGSASALEGPVIVEYADFQCPFCRRLHTRLAEILPDFPGVRVERRHVPLPAHEHAGIAARAASCAEEAGRGEAMADALFSAAIPDRATSVELAGELGLDVGAFESCLDSSRVAERLAADLELARADGVEGLPTLIVGDQRFVGVPTETELRSSLEALR